MTPATIGYVCSTCGHVRRYQTGTSPSPIEDQPRLTESVPPSAVSESPSPPQIINHHSSSHYRKRLQQRLALLKRPEINAPEPEPLLEPIIPTVASQSPATDTPIPTPAPSPLKVQPEPVEASTSELTPAEQAFLASVRPKPTTGSTELDKIALSKADALLAAAAAQPSKTAPHTRVSLLVGSSVALLIFASYVGWQLFRPIDKIPTKTTTSTPTPSATAKPQSSDQAKRDATRKSDLNGIAVGLEAYKKATGSYPAGNDIAVLYPLQETNPPYIARINYDPLTNSSDSKDRVKYGYSSDGKAFTLTATLENHQDTDTKDGQYVVKSQ